MGLLSGVLTVVCLTAAVLHLARLGRGRDPAGELAHLAMALGMAAMLSPFGSPVPTPTWAAVFVAAAVWFTVAAVRRRDRRGDAPHHVVGSAAMLFMLAFAHPTGGGHAGGGSLGASLLAVALLGYYGWYVLRCADRCRRNPGPGPARAPVALSAMAPSTTALATWPLHTPRVAAVAHLAVGAAMAVMLLGLV